MGWGCCGVGLEIAFGGFRIGLSQSSFFVVIWPNVGYGGPRLGSWHIGGTDVLGRNCEVDTVAEETGWKVEEAGIVDIDAVDVIAEKLECIADGVDDGVGMADEVNDCWRSGLVD